MKNAESKSCILYCKGIGVIVTKLYYHGEVTNLSLSVTVNYPCCSQLFQKSVNYLQQVGLPAGTVYSNSDLKQVMYSCTVIIACSCSIGVMSLSF